MDLKGETPNSKQGEKENYKRNERITIFRKSQTRY